VGEIIEGHVLEAVLSGIMTNCAETRDVTPEGNIDSMQNFSNHMAPLIMLVFRVNDIKEMKISFCTQFCPFVSIKSKQKDHTRMLFVRLQQSSARLQPKSK